MKKRKNVIRNIVFSGVSIGLALVMAGCKTSAPSTGSDQQGSTLYHGLGAATNARDRRTATAPNQVNINDVVVYALFDNEGKIVAMNCDILEIAAPVAGISTGTPAFLGWPEQTANTTEAFIAQADAWVTKRDRGSGYNMGKGTWDKEMDHYQDFFRGKTVAEIQTWVTKYTDSVGRPLQEIVAAADQPKYNALSQADKNMLADLTNHTDAVTGATMSLNDPHGNIILALERAYNNRTAIAVSGAKSIGLGIISNGRALRSTYTLNHVFAGTVLGEDGKILASRVDILEIATPNYDGEDVTMPHLTGFPGQAAIDYRDHDAGNVIVKVTPSWETLDKEASAWVTKRDRGSNYKMVTGTWASQMDRFEKLFTGKTPAEVENWVGLYADNAGRPLQSLSTGESKAKYDALSQADKAMLADVVSSATMSLTDSHGYITTALKKSAEDIHRISIK